MPLVVTQNALIMCPFGVAPVPLNVIPKKPVMACGMLVASVMCNIPMVNIMPFGMCTSLANPQVASATASAAGVLQPQPCIPVTIAPWLPPGKTLIAGEPVLLQPAMLICAWLGVIAIISPGQFKVMAS